MTTSVSIPIWLKEEIVFLPPLHLQLCTVKFCFKTIYNSTRHMTINSKDCFPDCFVRTTKTQQTLLKQFSTLMTQC